MNFWWEGMFSEAAVVACFKVVLAGIHLEGVGTVMRTLSRVYVGDEVRNFRLPGVSQKPIVLTLLLLLLLLLSSSSSSSSSVSTLCRVSTLIFLRQTVSLGNTVLQLF